MYQNNCGNQQYCALCFEKLSLKGNFIRNEVFKDACCSMCRESLHRQPQRTEFCGINVYSEYIYQEDIRLAILRYKESRDKYLARIFLHPYWSYYFRKHYVVLVPSTQSSFERRGFDHIELLALHSGFKDVHHIFENKGKEQQALKKEHDRKNVRGEIKLKNHDDIKGRKILILDDIITSGNTILACAELLKPHVFSIDVLTIARSPQLKGDCKLLNLPFI